MAPRAASYTITWDTAAVCAPVGKVRPSLGRVQSFSNLCASGARPLIGDHPQGGVKRRSKLGLTHSR
ncbi:hypothetical protein BQ8482_130210 [Mesorhizobium delmotii]|uniref:Uncharacterized protein n=1 Tax=Mesorhizobium delmotii TaxID=1631247 RepID=A0A2P9AGQ7_9HYPH|nr:hypothetical protein BQ8482_130210 [Mesorhizobium delmotii]